MRARKEKPIFRGLTIAAVGSLGGSAQWSDANIARWVGLREGRFVREGAGVALGVSAGVGVRIGGEGVGIAGEGGGIGGEVVVGGGGEVEVTHVVCTGEEFKRGGRLGMYFCVFLFGLVCLLLGVFWARGG